MAQTPAQRRAAQRKLAKALKQGESVLGGDFGRKAREVAAAYSEEKRLQERLQDYERDEALRFGRQEGVDEVIPFTYRPTKTTWPGNGWKHRRTTAAGYDRLTETLRVQFFTNGAVYDYYNVPPAVARQFRRAESPGKFINSVLNGYEYSRVD